MAPFMSGLWVVWKFTPWRFRYCWTVALRNSVPSSDCIVIGFLFWNKDFKAAVIEVPVFSFIGTLQAYRENISMTFKRYLCLSLYFERELKSARSISQTSSMFVTVCRFRANLLRACLCKCTCLDLTATPSHLFYYFYWPLLTLLLTRTLLRVKDHNKLRKDIILAITKAPGVP